MIKTSHFLIYVLSIFMICSICKLYTMDREIHHKDQIIEKMLIHGVTYEETCPYEQGECPSEACSHYNPEPDSAYH